DRLNRKAEFFCPAPSYETPRLWCAYSAGYRGPYKNFSSQARAEEAIFERREPRCAVNGQGVLSAPRQQAARSPGHGSSKSNCSTWFRRYGVVSSCPRPSNYLNSIAYFRPRSVGRTVICTSSLSRVFDTANRIRILTKNSNTSMSETLNCARLSEW